MKDHPRISHSLDAEEEKSLAIIKAHYGTQSPHVAIRYAIIEHAKHITEPVKQIMPIRYDRRGNT